MAKGEAVDVGPVSYKSNSHRSKELAKTDIEKKKVKIIIISVTNSMQK